MSTLTLGFTLRRRALSLHRKVVFPLLPLQSLRVALDSSPPRIL